MLFGNNTVSVVRWVIAAGQRWEKFRNGNEGEGMGVGEEQNHVHQRGELKEVSVRYCRRPTCSSLMLHDPCSRSLSCARIKEQASWEVLNHLQLTFQ